MRRRAQGRQRGSCKGDVSCGQGEGPRARVRVTTARRRGDKLDATSPSWRDSARNQEVGSWELGCDWFGVNFISCNFHVLYHMSITATHSLARGEGAGPCRRPGEIIESCNSQTMDSEKKRTSPRRRAVGGHVEGTFPLTKKSGKKVKKQKKLASK